MIFEGLNHGRLGKAGQGLGLTLDRSLGQRGSMQMLLAYLAAPDIADWERLAATYVLTWLSSAAQWLAPEAGAQLESRLRTEPQHFQPGPTAQVGRDAPVLTRQGWQGWFAFLGRSSSPSLQEGHVERLLLRLFDEKKAREAPDFEASWRSFLQAWNLLQFSGGVEVVSSELVALEPYAQAEVDSGLIAADRLHEEYDAAPRGIAAELLDYATEASRPLILAVVRAGLPLPVDDFELETEEQGCGPEPELAWPKHRLAVLAGNQAEDSSVFERAGWRVLVQPVDEDELLVVVGDIQSRVDSTGGSE